MKLEEKLSALPTLPGVYLMKGAGGEVIYVGKAKNLRARVRSYFRESPSDSRYATRYLAGKVVDIETIVTTTENEALILEDTLLKKHRPRYNIRLKDDKTYVSIKITTNEPFPRISTTRRVKKDGARYFGPYGSSSMVRETIKVLRRIFPLRICGKAEFNNRVRPCLDYQMGICAAPAAGFIDEHDYRRIVDGAIMFLEGKNRDLLKGLKAEMREASKNEDFERAALLRDRIVAIESTLEEQKVVSSKGADQDVMAMERDGEVIVMEVLNIREGRLVAAADYSFKDNLLPGVEIFSSFIPQYYRGERFVPAEVVVEESPGDAAFIRNWLTEKKGSKVSITKPSRGVKTRLLDMARDNARESLKKRLEDKTSGEVVLDALARRLRLGVVPDTIEAFDISNIGPSHAVGAMVVFKDAEPFRDGYRRYRIKDTKGPDDYAMMKEVLRRRYCKAGVVLPDLIVIDGGKGQLAIALTVLDELGITGVAVCSLAKEYEEAKGEGKRVGERVFLPGVKDPVFLKEGRGPDLLLRRIRDEVHSQAVGYHRKVRSKAIRSVLEDIPGIGAARKKALFARFADLAAMAGASLEELSEVPGINQELAKAIKEKLKN